MTIDVSPNIVGIGGLNIAWHGVLVAVAIALTMWIGLYNARRYKLDPQDMVGMFPWAIILGLIGARISHVADNWSFYSRYPAQIFSMWTGGMGWYGGLIGATLAVVLYTRFKHLALGRLLDSLVLGGFLGLAVGRVGCFLNGDSWGTPTSLPWATTYVNPDTMAPIGVPGHPAALYELIWIVLMVVVLYLLRRRFVTEGSLFLTSVATYSVGRFIISWTRGEPAVLGPLHQAHIFSIVLFLGSVGLLAYLHYRKAPRAAARHKATR